MVDAGTVDPDHPLDDYETVNKELKSFDAQLTQKPQIVVLNKMDLTGAEDAADAFTDALQHEPVILISAIKKKGVKKLISRILELLDRSYDK